MSNDGRVKLISSAVNMEQTMNHVWAIIPTNDRGYVIRSGSASGKYLGVQNCSIVNVSSAPYTWDIYANQNEISIEARNCQVKKYLSVTDGIIVMSEIKDTWLATNILASKQMFA